jgi:hypothetical protein
MRIIFAIPEIYWRWRQTMLTILKPSLQRPDLYAPAFTIELNDPERVTPGYIFIAPYESDNPGPYIYDNEGVR